MYRVFSFLVGTALALSLAGNLSAADCAACGTGGCDACGGCDGSGACGGCSSNCGGGCGGGCCGCQFKTEQKPIKKTVYSCKCVPVCEHQPAHFLDCCSCPICHLHYKRVLIKREVTVGYECVRSCEPVNPACCGEGCGCNNGCADGCDPGCGCAAAADSGCATGGDAVPVQPAPTEAAPVAPPAPPTPAPPTPAPTASAEAVPTVKQMMVRAITVKATKKLSGTANK